MKTRHPILGGAALTVVLASSASAEVTHESYTVKGDAVMASWHSMDGCVSTAVNLHGIEQRFRVSGETAIEERALGLEVVRFDRCTFHLVEMWGWTSDASVELDGTNGGGVDGEITLEGQRCGDLGDTFGCESITPVTLDLFVEYTGAGEVMTGRSVSTTRMGTAHVSHRYYGENRDATATGSFVLDGTELLVGNSYARLERVTTGTQSITRR